MLRVYRKMVWLAGCFHITEGERNRTEVWNPVMVMHGDTVKISGQRVKVAALLMKDCQAWSAKNMTVLMYLLPPRTTPEILYKSLNREGESRAFVYAPAAFPLFATLDGVGSGGFMRTVN